ncbi:zinc finger protein 821 [Bombina bombina]|uniref:zinc finger protein 821 n=1 Tax=Bombina bombina TaxID=8345 RepID=UPI00235A6A61|nr:zinc finger protein 821 [Bombina bombina]
MSRRKQTTPNKVHWEQVFAGLEQQARQAMMKTELMKQEESGVEQHDRSSSDSDAEDTTNDDFSSPASEDDTNEEANEPGISREIQSSEETVRPGGVD